MNRVKMSTFIVSVPEPYFDAVYRLANEHNKQYPDHFQTIDDHLTEAVCEYVDRVERMKAGLEPETEQHTFYVKEDTM